MPVKLTAALLGAISCRHWMSSAITEEDVEAAQVGGAEFDGVHVGGWREASFVLEL